MTETFRVYTNPDVVGCEIAGALKNVIAIAAGIADGLGYGDNTKAALITRGLAELARLGIALGGDPLTFSGLAGMGDLVATCTSDEESQPHRRRRAREGPGARRDRRRDEDGRGGCEVAPRPCSSSPSATTIEHADRRAGRRRALRGAAGRRDRPRADAARGQARAPRDAREPARAHARRGAGLAAPGPRRRGADRSSPTAPAGRSTGGSAPTTAGTCRAPSTPIRQHLARRRAGRRDPVLRVPGGDAVAAGLRRRRLGGIVLASRSRTRRRRRSSSRSCSAHRSRCGALARRQRRVGRRSTGEPVLRTVQPARRWAVAAPRRSVRHRRRPGPRPMGAFPLTRDRAGDLAAAFLLPARHRNRRSGSRSWRWRSTPWRRSSLRPARPAGGRRRPRWAGTRSSTGACRSSLPDERVQAAVDAGPGAGAPRRPTRARATAATALEDWGFDTEASTMWRQLGLRDRRRAAQRDDVPRPWDLVRERLASASPTLTWPDGPGPLLAAVRALLVAEQEDGSVDLAHRAPGGVGRPVARGPRCPDARAARCRSRSAGTAARPALLWEVTRPGVPELALPGTRRHLVDHRPGGRDPARGAHRAAPVRARAPEKRRRAPAQAGVPASSRRVAMRPAAELVHRPSNGASARPRGRRPNPGPGRRRARRTPSAGASDGLKHPDDEPARLPRSTADTGAPSTRSGRPVAGRAAPVQPPPRTRSSGTSTSSATS